jgi:O-glycosyl hydrolase
MCDQPTCVSNHLLSVLTSRSAPQWMKTQFSFVGGSLNPAYYQTYASYFVKYVQSMAANNITIAAVTVQNEPVSFKDSSYLK